MHNTPQPILSASILDRTSRFRCIFLKYARISTNVRNRFADFFVRIRNKVPLPFKCFLTANIPRHTIPRVFGRKRDPDAINNLDVRIVGHEHVDVMVVGYLSEAFLKIFIHYFDQFVSRRTSLVWTSR